MSEGRRYRLHRALQTWFVFTDERGGWCWISRSDWTEMCAGRRNR